MYSLELERSNRVKNALSDILKNQLDIYLKMCGPYVSPDTIKLLSNAPSGIDILVLTDNIKDANTQSSRK
jgi:hypothetical protein